MHNQVVGVSNYVWNKIVLRKRQPGALIYPHKIREAGSLHVNRVAQSKFENATMDKKQEANVSVQISRS
jgi:hypothetical protein